ncbi:MAG: valine--tRNA ligase [Thermoplasmata archaeon]
MPRAEAPDRPVPAEDAAGAMPPRFDPAAVDRRWQAAWEAAGAFRAPDRPGPRPFSMALPPPNVTGVLTLGHILGGTVMDSIVRRARMQGRPTAWIPGVDHAGLATQVEVRRRLAKEGVRLEALPREEALLAIERWVREHEARIREQMRAAGLSVDWSRFRYTMDEGAIRATREAFVRLYREGLIYRGERMVNWDPRLETAISDLEVVHAEEEAELVTVRYRWADGAPGGIDVATVRPETILGDVALAVHPDDPRYAAAVGREVVAPFTGRRIPVIADAAIDPAFGTGVLKVTPRHDTVDYAIARRHPELPIPEEIFDARARLTGPLVPRAWQGLDRDAARTEATAALEAQGLLVRRERFRHSVSRSERTGAVVEPRLSTQWFLRMGPLAEPAVAAVRDGRIRIHPARWERTFFRWMEGIEDWCLSRQILWGHRIPVYRCRPMGHECAEVEPPKACPRCGSADLEQDPDVLDTWFTSWMWPFLSLGWPEETEDLARYYPTEVLVTGRDIMFFWVARMMIAGLYFTGRPPFAHVVFTGMLRDEEGRRMSKHLGNSPDPLSIVGARGADALRFAVVFPNPVEEDGPFGAAALDGARNFLTKLWNVARFCRQHLPDDTPPMDRIDRPPPDAALEDRWILSRWERTREEVDRAMDEFAVSRAAGALYQFVWHDLADRYLEAIKDRLAGARGPASQRAARDTLFGVVDRAVRALHPFVPHVTEEIWHALPHRGELLATAPWPAPAPLADPAAEGAMETIWEAVRLLRNLRAEEGIAADAVPAAWIRPADAEARGRLDGHRATIARLARVGPLTLLPPEAAAPEGSAGRVAPFGELYMARPAGTAGEGEALRREREKLSALRAKHEARLADPGFRTRAPPSVVAELEEKVRELAARIERIDAHLRPEGS